MTTYTYHFTDGTVNAVEVSDELFDTLTQADKRERNDNKRETRRHISLNYLNGNGIDFETEGGDPLDAVLVDEDTQAFEEKLSCLKPRQLELLNMFLFDCKTVTQIAKELGCSHPTISKRLKVIFGKLKDSF
jgi:RNA polymerase sigma-70 factor (ECF subfamily)